MLPAYYASTLRARLRNSPWVPRSVWGTLRVRLGEPDLLFAKSTPRSHALEIPFAHLVAGALRAELHDLARVARFVLRQRSLAFFLGETQDALEAAEDSRTFQSFQRIVIIVEPRQFVAPIVGGARRQCRRRLRRDLL